MNAVWHKETGRRVPEPPLRLLNITARAAASRWIIHHHNHRQNFAAPVMLRSCFFISFMPSSLS